MNIQAGSDNGFSLFEVLIASTLAALLAVVLFGGLNMGVRVMDAGLSHPREASDLTLTHNFLRSHLARGQPLLTPSVGRFEGQVDRIAFSEAASDYTRPGDNFIVIRTERVDGTLRLVVSSSLVAERNDVNTHHSLLLDKLASAEFSYFGTRVPGQPEAWHSEWGGLQTLPSLVRLRVVLSKGHVTQDFLVALRLAESPLARSHSAVGGRSKGSAGG